MRALLLNIIFLFPILNMGLISANSESSSLESSNPYYIGEVGNKWQFPSDHLPRGVSIGNLHFAFWNILNKNYLGHIQDNNQGLRDSSILADNVPLNGKTKLTIRELYTINIIMDMIHHSTHPRSLIGLEETHPDVRNYLLKNLPTNWVIITPPDQPNSQDLYLYNKDVFDYIGISAKKYHSNLPKTIFTILLQEKATGNKYRFIQSHIPGGPNLADGAEKFADEAMKQYRFKETIVLMGDMNASPIEIQTALEKAAEKAALKQPFHYVSIDYPSHINTNLEASWIDNFFVYKPKLTEKIHASQSPEEIHDSVRPIYDLFKAY